MGLLGESLVKAEVLFELFSGEEFAHSIFKIRRKKFTLAGAFSKIAVENCDDVTRLDDLR